jgi:two-component system chemotaxis response regulator CheB
VRQLPADFGAALAVVVHGAATRGHDLPRLLSAAGPLPATVVQDGEAIKAGDIYIAPHGQHLLVDDMTLRLSYEAETIGRGRPSIHSSAVVPRRRREAAARAITLGR